MDPLLNPEEMCKIESINRDTISSQSTDLHTSNNQLIPDQVQLNNLQQILTTKEKFIKCPFCKAGAMTRVESTISVKSTLFCIFSFGFVWGITQCVRKKELNCNDAKHYCPACSNCIAQYNSC